MDGLYMGINIPEVERQKASKALNCDRQCPLWVKSRHSQLRCNNECPLCGNSGHRIVYSITSSERRTVEPSEPSQLGLIVPI